MDDLVASGELSSTHADALKGHTGPVMVPELLQRIAAQTATRTGQDDRLTAALPDNAATPTTGRGPVVDPLRWQAARADYQSHAEGLAQQAERMSNPNLALAIRQIATAPRTADKATLAADYMKALPGASTGARLQRAMAAQFLGGPLMRGVN